MTFAKLSGALLARKEVASSLTLAELVSVPRVAPPPIAEPAAPPAVSPAPEPTVPSAVPRSVASAAGSALSLPTSDNDAERLLAERLKALKLPAFLREHDRVARQCAAEGLDPSHYLLRLTELELIERERRLLEQRVKAAGFPIMKRLEEFNFAATPSVDRDLVTELASGTYIERRENIVMIGNSGTGKTHLAIALGTAACEQGCSVGFMTAVALTRELLEASDERRLARFYRQLAAYKVLIVDELGYVPLPARGAELLFEVISRRYERGSTIITSDLRLDQWHEVFGNPDLASAVIDRLSHKVHLLEMYGASYRGRRELDHARGLAADKLAQSPSKRTAQRQLRRSDRPSDTRP